MPINLGSAAFSLGINAANFAAGMTKAGSAVAGFAASATSGMAKSAKSYNEFSKQSSVFTSKIEEQKRSIDELTKTVQSQEQVFNVANSAYQKQVMVIETVTQSIDKQEAAIKSLAKSKKQWVADKSADLANTAYKQTIDDINTSIDKQKASIASLMGQRNKIKQQSKIGYVAQGMTPADAGRAASDLYTRSMQKRRDDLKALLDLQKTQTKLIGVDAVQAYDAEVTSQEKVLGRLREISTEQSKVAIGAHQIMANAQVDLSKVTSELNNGKVVLNQLQQRKGDLGPEPLKPISGLAKINQYASSIKAASDSTTSWLNNAQKGMERFSRGIFKTNQDIINQREKVYAAEMAIKSHSARVAQAEQAVKSYATEFQIWEDQQIHRTKQIEASYAMEIQKKSEIADEQRILNKLLSSNAPATAIAEQQSKIQRLDQELQRHDASTQVLISRQKDDLNVRKELETKYASAQAWYAKLKDGSAALSSSLKEEKTKLGLLVDKIKDKAEKDKIAKKNQDDLTKSMDEQGKKLNWLQSLWAKLFGGSSAIKNTANDMNTLASSTDKAGSASMRLKQFFTSMVATGIGTFLGNIASQMQGMAGSALTVYKNNELMQLSLKNMLAAQDRQKDSTLSVVDSQKQAIGEAKELDKWMKTVAIQSPFSQNDIKDGMQLGLSLGFNVEQMKRLTNATVDWASASGKSGEEMTQVTRAMGQMNANGKVTLEDLNQLTNVGIGWSSVLEKEFAPEIAKSGKSLRDLISAGIVPADRAIGALTKSFEDDFKGGAAQAGDSVTGLLASLGDIKDAALQAGFESIFEALKPVLKAFTDFFVNGPAIAQIRAFGTALGEHVGQAVQYVSNLMPTLISIWNNFAPSIFQTISSLSEFATYTYDWGAALIQQFSQGIMDNVQPIIDAVQWIGDLLSEWMMPHSPPKFLPDIDVWGTKTMQTYLGGMNQADFSVISDVGDQVRSILSANGSTNIASTMMGTQDVMTKALDEFKRIGTVSESTFAQLRSAAGDAGEKVELYARSMFEAQKATQKVTAAQKTLNDVTAKYDALLAPLNAQLDAIRNKQAGNQIADEIKSLQEQLKFQNPEGMGFDKSQIESRLKELTIEQQINQIQSERDDQVSKAEVVLTAAEAEQKQKQDNLDLIKDQIDFENKRKNLITEQNDEIERQQKLLEEGSDKAVNASDKEEKAALKLSDAQFKSALAQATSAEKVQLLTDRLATLNPDTLEYVQTQQQLAKAQDAYNQELDKTDDAEFKLNLSRASATEQVQMYQDKLATLTPGTLEYIKTQKELEKVQASLEESANKLSDADFAAQLAGMKREDQIVAMQERMKGMTEGTLEYANAQKKLNGLELAQQKADETKLKKSGGGFGKGGPMLASKPFAGVKESAEEVLEPVRQVSKSLNEVSTTAAGYAGAVKAFFARLKEYGSQFGYIISRFAAGFVFFLAVNKIVKPFIEFVMGLGRFLTPINLLMLALIGIGYIIREDIGGIQGIISRALKDIMPMVDVIMAAVNGIIAAFQTGNIDTIIQSVMAGVPVIISELGSIGARIGEAVKQWVGPFIQTALPILQDIFTSIFTDIGSWMQNGGIGKLFENITGVFNNGFDNLGKWMQTFGVAYLMGGMGIITSIVGDQIVKNVPQLQEKFNVWKAAFVDWMLEVFPRIMNTIGIIAAGLTAGLLKGAIAAAPGLLKIGLEWLNIIASMIPGLVKALTGFIATFVTWLFTDGIVSITRAAQQIMSVLLDWIIKSGPTFFYEIGNLLGDVAGKILGAVGVIIGYWIAQGPAMRDEYFNWIKNDFGPKLGDLLKGIFINIAAVVSGFFIGLFAPVFDFLNVFVNDSIQNVLKSFGVALDQGQVAAVKKWVDFWDSMVTGVKKLLGIASPSTVFIEIGEQVIQGALDGIRNMEQSFIDAMLIIWTTIYDNTIGKVTDIITIVTTKWTDFSGKFVKLTEDMKKLILITILQLFSKAIQAITTFVEDGMTKFNKFHTDATTIFDNVSTAITTAIGNARDLVITIIDDLVQKVSDAFDKLKTFFGNSEFLRSIGESAKSIGKGIIKGITDGFEGALESLKTALLNFLKSAVGQMLEEWKNNFFSNWHPSAPSSTNVTTSGGGDVAGGSNNPLTAGGGSSEVSSILSGPQPVPLIVNPVMVDALFKASKTNTPLPFMLGAPTYHDLAAFVQRGGKLNRSIIAMAANPIKFKRAGWGTEASPYTISQSIDLPDAQHYIESLANVDTGSSWLAQGAGQIGATNNQATTTTNNFSATFATTRDSMGLMNDFNIMKTLRKV